MLSPAPRALWTLADTAALLEQTCKAGTAVLALWPTTSARLLQLASVGERVAMAFPECVLDALPGEQLPELRAFDAVQGASSVRGPFVGSSDRDRHHIRQPLTALAATADEALACVRVRTIDSLFADLQRCAILMVEGPDLLPGASELISRHQPILVVDLAAGARDRIATGTIVDAPPLTPYGYRLLEVSGRASPQGRFAVLMPASTAEYSPRPRNASSSSSSSTESAIPPLAANADWHRGKRRLVWTGRAPGLVLVSEQPGETTRARILLASTSVHGLNIFLNGRREHPLGSRPTESGLELLEFAAVPGRSADRLLTVQVTPIRPSTTTAISSLEIGGLSFA